MVNRCRRGLFSRVLNVYILFRRSTLNRHVPTEVENDSDRTFRSLADSQLTFRTKVIGPKFNSLLMGQCVNGDVRFDNLKVLGYTAMSVSYTHLTLPTIYSV